MGANTNPAAVTADHVTGTLYAIRRLVRTVRTLAGHVERDTGLSTAQTFVLQLLDDAPAESMNDLAARTSTDQSSVSVVVSRLEAKGLVSRAHSGPDARRTRVSITPLGRNLLGGKRATVQSKLVRALEAMPADGVAVLERQLTTLVALMGAEHEPASLIFEDDATGTP